MQYAALDRQVSVVEDAEHHAGYAGLRRCGLRACPWCAHHEAMRTYHRARAVAQEWVDEGSILLMATFTMRHTVDEPLLTTKDAFLAAQHSMHSGRPWRRFAREYGIGDRFHGNELTDGGNGWHMHRHTVYQAKLPPWVRHRRSRRAFAKQMEREFTDLHLAALAKHGRDALPGIAVKVTISSGIQEDPGAAARYVSKCVLEATSAATKDGRNGSRSPWQLLDDAQDASLSDAQRNRARARFREFVEATKGIHWAFFSEGCREVLAKVDAEHEWSDDDPGTVVMTLGPAEWACVRYFNRQVELLELVEDWGPEIAAAILAEWCASPEWLKRKNSYTFEGACTGP